MELQLLIGLIGAVTGFLSGLLGIGGGIIMAPLLLYVPVVLGFPPLSMHTVAGLTIVQGFVACISGGITHGRSPFFSTRLARWMGGVLFVFSFVGGAGSRALPPTFLLLVFALMAFAAALLMLFKLEREEEAPDTDAFVFSRLRAVLVAAGVGFFGGLVGQGGSFILIPLMVSFMGVPTRIAVGTNLAIVFLSTGAAFLGKAVTAQIDWILALPIVLTVLPFAFVGARVSRSVPVDNLKIILAVCIAFAAFRIGFTAFGF
ncbi:MAG: sulfite exporter TauE/SafE family protein [Desulfobulbaceae bacterium]